jgi:DNA-directed RNA polymerase specialized sigma24 family protein
MPRRPDAAEEVALVVRAKRELLLRAHRNRLRREDLEDCYSQAALELVAHACKGGAFWSRVHVGNVLEQRFLSRINDRRRALSGRSPMQAALEGAVSICAAGESEIEIADVRAELEALVMLRHDLARLERLAREHLTRDQRLVLAWQVGLPLLSTREFCRRFGWSEEKYRKVAQRARTRLRALMAADDPVAAERRPPGGRRLPTERPPSKRPGRE